MFKQNPAFSSFSTDDIEKTKQFYGETLGLEIKESPMGLDIRLSGGGRVFIYPKQNHTSATFTVLNFIVDDIDKAVDDLTQADVTFEQYNGDPIETDEKGIARAKTPEEGPSIAWFKDPAGNILSVLESTGMDI